MYLSSIQKLDLNYVLHLKKPPASIRVMKLPPKRTLLYFVSIGTPTTPLNQSTTLCKDWYTLSCRCTDYNSKIISESYFYIHSKTKDFLFVVLHYKYIEGKLLKTLGLVFWQMYHNCEFQWIYAVSRIKNVLIHLTRFFFFFLA